MRLSEPATKILMKIRTILSAAKCSSVILLSASRRLMRTRGLPGRGVKRHWGCHCNSTTAIFNVSLAISSETLEIRPALLGYICRYAVRRFWHYKVCADISAGSLEKKMRQRRRSKGQWGRALTLV